MMEYISEIKFWNSNYFLRSLQTMSQIKSLRLLQRLNSIPRLQVQSVHTQPKKRFYKNVSVIQSNGQFEINLDHRKLKTPLGSPLLVRLVPISDNKAKIIVFRSPMSLWPMLLQTNGCHRRRK